MKSYLSLNKLILYNYAACGVMSGGFKKYNEKYANQIFD